jgi:hypothetical protein
MIELCDAEGAVICAIPISEMQLEEVDAGGTTAIQWHMPNRLRALGEAFCSGSFSVGKSGNTYVTDDPASARQYATIQERVRRTG